MAFPAPSGTPARDEIDSVLEEAWEREEASECGEGDAEFHPSRLSATVGVSDAPAGSIGDSAAAVSAVEQVGGGVELFPLGFEEGEQVPD